MKATKMISKAGKKVSKGGKKVVKGTKKLAVGTIKTVGTPVTYACIGVGTTISAVGLCVPHHSFS